MRPEKGSEAGSGTPAARHCRCRAVQCTPETETSARREVARSCSYSLPHGDACARVDASQRLEEQAQSTQTSWRPARAARPAARQRWRGRTSFLPQSRRLRCCSTACGHVSRRVGRRPSPVRLAPVRCPRERRGRRAVRGVLSTERPMDQGCFGGCSADPGGAPSPTASAA